MSIAFINFLNIFLLCYTTFVSKRRLRVRFLRTSGKKRSLFLILFQELPNTSCRIWGGSLMAELPTFEAVYVGETTLDVGSIPTRPTTINRKWLNQRTRELKPFFQRSEAPRPPVLTGGYYLKSSCNVRRHMPTCVI